MSLFTQLINRVQRGVKKVFQRFSPAQRYPAPLAALHLLRLRFLGEQAGAITYTKSIVALAERNPVAGITSAAQMQGLVAVTPDDGIPGDYSGPALIEMKTGAWCFVPDGNELHGSTVTFWSSSDRQWTQLGIEAFQRQSSGRAVLFPTLMPDSKVMHTGIACLALIGRHHGLDLNERRLTHEYAIDQKEPSFLRLAEIADDCGMRDRQIRLPWEKAVSQFGVYPILGRKRSGSYYVMAGVKDEPNGDQKLAVIDPAPEASEDIEREGPYYLWSRDTYERVSTGDALLLRRRYQLTDEQQPFGLRWFLPEFFKLKGVFTQISVAVVMMTLLSLVIPLFFQIIIDKVLPNSSFTTLNVLGIGIMLAIAFNGVLSFLRNWLLLFATNKIDINTATKTFAHLMRLPLDFFEAVPSGLLIKHMQQTEKIRGFLSGNLFFTILDLFSLVVFIPFLMTYSLGLTGIVLGFSMLIAIVIMMLIKPFQRRLDALYQAEGKRQSRLVESIHGIRTVKSLALEPVEEREWDNASAYAIQANFSVGKISITANTLSQTLEMLMNVAVIWAGAHMVFNRTLTIGELIAFQMISGRVSGPLVKLVGLIHEYQQTALSVKMLGSVMNAPKEPAGGGVRQGVGGEITLEHVTFKYRPNLPAVLNDVSLQVNPGETIGIVGRSGSGKSTLVRLIQAIARPQSGMIKIDGIDIREIDKAHLRRNVGIVLQENYFFQGTIRDNIRLTRRDASMEEVIRAAKMAGAHEFISKFPKGYDTVLEENASNLSGGQKQRLAIARALLQDPPILIFDEATSALDPESEQIIKENLNVIAKGRTLLIVSHRLSMVRHADKIVVIDGGNIVECAPHDILVHREGLYKTFWQQQMGGTR